MYLLLTGNKAIEINHAHDFSKSIKLAFMSWQEESCDRDEITEGTRESSFDLHV